MDPRYMDPSDSVLCFFFLLEKELPLHVLNSRLNTREHPMQVINAENKCHTNLTASEEII